MPPSCRHHRPRTRPGAGTPLFFGRLDYEPGAEGRFYVGRRHIRDAQRDPVVLDWRAPLCAEVHSVGEQNSVTAFDEMAAERARLDHAAACLRQMYTYAQSLDPQGGNEIATKALAALMARRVASLEHDPESLPQLVADCVPGKSDRVYLTHIDEHRSVDFVPSPYVPCLSAGDLAAWRPTLVWVEPRPRS